MKTPGIAPLPAVGKVVRAALLVPVVVALVMVGFAPGACAQVPLFGDPVLAKGKGFEIKRSQVEEAYLRFKANSAANGQPVPESQREEIEKRILERLVIVRTVSDRATPEDKAEAQKRADKFYDDTKKQATSEASFKRQLLAMGLSDAEFRADILERAVVETVIERELRAKITITDEQVKKYYEDNPARFEQPELVKVLHLHLSTVDPETRRQLPTAERTKKRELADKALARAKGGEDFKRLVTELSDDVRTKERGGEYTIARGTMEPAFAGIEAAAFSMRPGQTSDVLETAFGYHILRVTERVPAKQVPFAEVSDRIRDNLRQQEVNKLLPDYLEQVKREAGVEIIGPAKS